MKNVSGYSLDCFHLAPRSVRNGVRKLVVSAVAAVLSAMTLWPASADAGTPHPQDSDEALVPLVGEILVLVPDDLLIEPFGIELETLVTDALGFEISSTATGTGTTFLVDDDLLDCPTAQFTSIQAAVDAASPADRIKVCPGTYLEHVSISKPLRVVGDLQNPSSTVIDGGTSAPADDHVAIHDTSGVEFAGFRVINANSNDAYIGLQRASDNKIHHNLIELNELACGPPPFTCFEPVGIFLYDNSDRNDVYRNTVIGDNNVGFPPGPSERGIMLFCETNPCDENRIRSNSISNVFNGIQVTDGQGNVIDHNESFGNGRGFRQFEFNFPTGTSRVQHNKFHNNVVQFSLGGDGINLSATSADTIHHNENNGNQRDGLLIGDGASADLITENVADDNGRDGIRAESGTSGNTIKNNKMGSVPNTAHDAHDNSLGTGTAGTANTWQNNMCNTSSPAGLCEHPL